MIQGVPNEAIPAREPIEPCILAWSGNHGDTRTAREAPVTNGVMRYSFFVSEDERGSPYVDNQEDPEYGEWVKYDDIKHLLHPEPECGHPSPLMFNDISAALVQWCPSCGALQMDSKWRAVNRQVEPAGNQARGMCQIANRPACDSYPRCQCGQTLPQANQGLFGRQWTPEEMARLRMQQAQNVCQGCFRPVSACICSRLNRKSNEG